MEQLARFGVSPKVISFVLPLGYSFNLDGSMMYCTFAVVFIAQAYNIDLSLGQQATMLLLLMVTSKGMAGVPRASLVVIAATLSTFNIPEAGLLLIIGIDQFLDMGRSATNVIGNSLAAAAVGKWEGDQTPEPGPGGAGTAHRHLRRGRGPGTGRFGAAAGMSAPAAAGRAPPPAAAAAPSSAAAPARRRRCGGGAGPRRLGRPARGAHRHPARGRPSAAA